MQYVLLSTESAQKKVLFATISGLSCSRPAELCFHPHAAFAVFLCELFNFDIEWKDYIRLRESCQHSTVVFMLLFLWRRFTGHTLWKLLSPYMAVSWWLVMTGTQVHCHIRFSTEEHLVCSKIHSKLWVSDLAICTAFNPLLVPSSLTSVLSTGHLSSVSVILWCLSSADFISRSCLLPPASLLRCPWLAQQQLLVYPP